MFETYIYLTWIGKLLYIYLNFDIKIFNHMTVKLSSMQLNLQLNCKFEEQKLILSSWIVMSIVCEYDEYKVFISRMWNLGVT